MKTIATVFTVITMLLLISLWWVASMMLAPLPTVTSDLQINAVEEKHIKALIKDIIRAPKDNETTKQISLSEQDINLGANYLLSKVPNLPQAGMQANFDANKANMLASVALPKPLNGQYFNLSAQLNNQSQPFSIHKLSIGKINIPNSIAKPFALMVDDYLSTKPQYQAFKKLALRINTVQFKPQLAQVNINWDAQLNAKIREQGMDMLAPGLNRARIQAYYTTLSQLTHQVKRDRARLIDLINDYYRLVQMRTESGANPIHENRAATIVLAIYLSEINAEKYLGKVSAPKPKKVFYELNQRQDLAQHYIISAAIAATAGKEVAQAIGIYKELHDAANKPSGFSFSDIAADEIGTRIGELMVKSAQDAKAMQEVLATIDQERQMMPNTSDLTNGISKAEFEKQYQSTHSPQYQQILQDIKDRVMACEIFKLHRLMLATF